MKKIVVLGGNGYIGKSFINFQKSFSNPIIVCRQSLKRHRRDEIVVDSYNKMPSDIFKDVDIVFNCIGVAHRNDNINKDLFYEINRDLTISLAEKARRQGVSKFIHISSMAVYGNKKYVDLLTPINPITNYGKSKADADSTLLRLQNHSFSVVLLRPPMIFGKGAPGNMGRLIDLIKKMPVVPFGNANEPREFLYVGNFCRFAESIMLSNSSGVFLLKDQRQFSTRELASIIIDELGLEKKIVNFPMKQLMKYLLPKYYAKLFGGLTIKSNYDVGSSEIEFFDAEKALREMIDDYKDHPVPNRKG